MNKSQLKFSGAAPSMIGFRLDGATSTVLNERASLFKQSSHELARQYVCEALMANEERSILCGRMAELEHQISELRKEFAHAVRVLLVSAGKIQPEHAEAFVEQNFNIDNE